MKFSRGYTLLLSVFLLGEPFVLHANWSSVGTWFWWVLGALGLIGWLVERKSSDRVAASS